LLHLLLLKALLLALLAELLPHEPLLQARLQLRLLLVLGQDEDAGRLLLRHGRACGQHHGQRERCYGFSP
jgi:hypothetical protein